MNFAQDSDPHIGYAMKSALSSGETMSANLVNGKYFDCGTPNEYLSMLREILS
jgi:UTP-glucose-1-phosphate uridylyltransferase